MENWYAEAQKLREEGMTTTDIALKLKLNPGTVRSRLSRMGVKKSNTDVSKSLIASMQKGCKLADLMKKFNLTSKQLNDQLDMLSMGGYLFDKDDDFIKLQTIVVASEANNIHNDWTGDKIIRFGLCGDNQYNSKYTQITYLHNFYDKLQSEGITDVYHTGDIDEGEEMRVGHKYECYKQGADDHVDEIVAKYPKRKGMTTHFITGNHDHSHIKRVGYDIGKTIAKERDDMDYLGMSDARIFLTPNCTMDLHHPIDGTAYAVSYKIQKQIEAMQGGEKPNIYAVGHYHKMEYFLYRNVHAFQTACFQAQTPWMRGKGIACTVGGWIVEVHVNDDGIITRLTSTFIPYYKMISEDYKNWE